MLFCGTEWNQLGIFRKILAETRNNGSYKAAICMPLLLGRIIFFHRKSMYWSIVGLLFIIHTNCLGLAICKAEFYFRTQLERCNYFVLAVNSCCHRKGCYRLIRTLRIIRDSYSYMRSLFCM